MKKKTKTFALLFLSLLLILAAGCGGGSDEQKYNKDAQEDSGSSVVIICSGFSEYDWTRNILGDNPAGIELRLLNTSGVDMHSYQPTARDMVRIAGCDLLIYTGGISEFWIDKAKESSDRDAMQTLSLMEYFEDHPELFPQYEQGELGHEHEASELGHEHESTSAHEHETSNTNAHEHEHEADEHIWLSLKMAPVFCEKIADAVSRLDPQNADFYMQNLSEYKSQLAALDKEFEKTVAAASKGSLLFADRFPFTYLSQDYGLQVHAAFDGCSAETEASFETIIDLANDLKTEGLSHILILKNSSSNLANTVIRAAKENSNENFAGDSGKDSGKSLEESKIKICELDSLQSVRSEDIENGFTYLDAMKKNKEVISECLN